MPGPRKTADRTVNPCLVRTIARRVRGISSSSTQRITVLDTAARSCCGLGHFQRFRRRIDVVCSSQASVRQEDLEAGDVSTGRAKTPEGDAASIFLNDALADPQPKAGALCRLGSEEGFKEVPRVFGIDANAGVADEIPRCRPADHRGASRRRHAAGACLHPAWPASRCR